MKSTVETAMKKRWKFGFIVVLMFCASFSFGQAQKEKLVPQRIVLNLTTEPATSMAVTWRTEGTVKSPVAQIAQATDWSDFEKSAKSVVVRTESTELDNKAQVYSHSVIMKGLRPNTLYAYRVGGDSVWSEWNQFTTARDEAAPFEFVFLGDPQYDIKELGSRVFREALRGAPSAKFWLFTGDLMDLPQYDRFWVEWFSATGFIHSIMPSILAPGSHEYALKTGETVRWDVFSPTWKAHFTLPENGPEGLKGRAYYIDYQGVRFVMLDAQTALKEQASWLEGVLAKNPNKWTIAAMHEPVFSIAEDRDGRDTRNAFMPLFDKYTVDLVLTGHDHGYARSKQLRDGNVVGAQERGTVYVVSVSGAKGYEHNPKYDRLMEKTGGRHQLYQVISFVDDKLMFKSFTVTGALYDSFELVKGSKR